MVRGRNSIIYDDIMVQSKLKSGNHTVSDLRLENSVCHDHLLYKHSITTKHSTRHSENYWFMVKLGHHDINKTIFCQDIDLKMTYGKSQQWRHWFQNDILEGPTMEALISKWHTGRSNNGVIDLKMTYWKVQQWGHWFQNDILEGPPMEALISKWQNIFSTIRKPNIWCCNKHWSQNGILFSEQMQHPIFGVKINIDFKMT
jgi:hypothetical protein